MYLYFVLVLLLFFLIKIIVFNIHYICYFYKGITCFQQGSREKSLDDIVLVDPCPVLARPFGITEFTQLDPFDMSVAVEDGAFSQMPEMRDPYCTAAIGIVIQSIRLQKAAIRPLR